MVFTRHKGMGAKSKFGKQLNPGPLWLPAIGLMTHDYLTND